MSICEGITESEGTSLSVGKKYWLNFIYFFLIFAIIAIMLKKFNEITLYNILSYTIPLIRY